MFHKDWSFHAESKGHKIQGAPSSHDSASFIINAHCLANFNIVRESHHVTFWIYDRYNLVFIYVECFNDKIERNLLLV